VGVKLTKAYPCGNLSFSYGGTACDDFNMRSLHMILRREGMREEERSACLLWFKGQSGKGHFVWFIR